MDIIIKKTENKNTTSYQINKEEFQIVFNREIPYTFQIGTKVEHFFKGIGTLYNIPGSFKPICLGSKHTDALSLQMDWERVGQSVYDGMIMFNQQ